MHEADRFHATDPKGLLVVSFNMIRKMKEDEEQARCRTYGTYWKD